MIKSINYVNKINNWTTFFQEYGYKAYKTFFFFGFFEDYLI